MNPSGMPDPTGTFPDRRQISVGQVFALVAGFLALAAIGATIGWTLTGSPKPHNNAGPPASPSVGTTSPSPMPSPTVSTAPSTSDVFLIPDYHALGADFVSARKELMSHKVSVDLVFNVPGSADSDVVSTDPPAGTPLTRGITVKMNVSGPPPILQVPQTQGESCSAAGRELAAAGLLVSYPYGRTGLVASTDPGRDASNVVWNQNIAVYCTPDGQPLQPTGGPSSPGDGSSASPGTSG